MRARLIYRLQRLEATTEANTLMVFQYGWLRRLPPEFAAEKHAVIVKREPSRRSNVEWCEFEERPGPLPPRDMNSESEYATVAGELRRMKSRPSITS